MTETIRYLISFLLYGHEEAVPLVGYGKAIDKDEECKVRIPLSENSPLAGTGKNWGDFYPEVEEALLHPKPIEETDIVSVSCFLLSRAEETVIAERDEHGRFLAAYSMAGRHNLLQIPIVDEYSRWLLKRVGLPLPEAKYSAINLTHDVDIMTRYRHMRGMLGGLKRGEWNAVWQSLRDVDNDPAFTFDWLNEKEAILKKKYKHSRSIWFIKVGSGKGKDAPLYRLWGKDWEHLLKAIKVSKGEIGLHTSYAAGGESKRIAGERKQLEKVLGKEVTLNRHHWLRSTTIENMQALSDAGFREDYSIGFADQAGFRLMTTRPVRWINPLTLELTPLTLHPLTVMDCTLSNTHYMNLDEDEAWYLCQRLFDKVKQCGGELNLLWHNHIFTEQYHKSLYTTLLNYLIAEAEEEIQTTLTDDEETPADTM